MKLASLSLFLDVSPPPPPRPKMPFGQLNGAMQIYNICKGRLGSMGGGKGGVYAKEDIKYLTKIDHCARWSFLLYITCINSFTVYSVIGRLVPLFNGLVPIYVTE